MADRTYMFDSVKCVVLMAPQGVKEYDGGYSPLNEKNEAKGERGWKGGNSRDNLFNTNASVTFLCRKMFLYGGV